FMGLIGIVQNDIKRVVAYSTLSQLGYMIAALGASAYAAGLFHLMTHAFFKALLFLAAGSVIIGMHHDQDIRNMGGLRKYMPITWITALVGSLALIGTPFLSGFYSKEHIIEAVHFANVPGAGIAYVALVAGVFVTAFYSFRMYFLVFHGKERWRDAHHGRQAHGAAGAAHGGHEADDAAAAGHDAHHHGLGPGDSPRESPAVVTVPLIMLALPSLVIGLVAVEPLLFGGFFKDSIAVLAERHPAMASLAEHFHGWAAFGLHAFVTLPFWLTLAGVAAAYYCYMVNPAVPAAIRERLGWIYRMLDNKYYMDRINEIVFAAGARLIGRGLWRGGDQALIDGVAIDGTARLVAWIASVVRLVQSGYIYHYAIVMFIGIAVLLWWFVPR
ncbi:MAG: NADH-quinone oxidoreductase subunit L, partial [Burkholderiales bacterium]